MRTSERGSVRLGRVEGDLRAERTVTIEAAEGSPVIVAGRALFEDGAEINCDFECESFTSRAGLIEANGNLVVHGGVDVEDSLRVKGSVRAKELDVGGTLSIAKDLECARVRVGGRLEVLGALHADEVETGGSVEAPGEVRIKKLDTHVTALGQRKTKNIEAPLDVFAIDLPWSRRSEARTDLYPSR